MIEKYIHKAVHNKDGKWKSIALGNLAKEMSTEQLRTALGRLPELLRLHRVARIDTLRGLSAPDIIMRRELAELSKVETGKHPALNTLRRELSKRENGA